VGIPFYFCKQADGGRIGPKHIGDYMTNKYKYSV
jgi:hypothetical protein